MPPRRQRPRESPALVAFGRQMRRLREAKAVKQETIAQLTTMSGAQISRIENGKRRATRSFVEIVDDHLDAGGSLINLWEDLNKDGHPVPIWFDWPQIEADAAILVCYEHSVIPGLAQTPAYALAILRGNQEAADARLKRQAILTKDGGKPPLALLLLIDEQVLARLVGTPETMKDQLEHLVAMSSLPNVTIQVVLGSGEHDGNMGAFVVATMEDRSEVAYIETAVRGITTDNPAELSILARTLIDLRSRALTQEMSCELIGKVIGEKWT
ncbi:helix-turn-helix domain-containing protein [Actinomadura madurae]|uniref:helix-turn-helix domain-containing protein n=1 Tax=Actinomadura madurae TaxID=1993 RepID=UPI0020D215F5|nr:helix-turn-helix transcriptional regulator [Actinomadura madurae]MCP9951562.1 helix-turn-helix domain-containing protein [Actinomadura madurae]MCP9968333.1 helix-turn-helix domain-containing protein [Actinomadura madurae]MCP9980799.1 helix-turn-helix domain-containing protein [Actinomadura madurae]MCQ0007703.1 helix-turn-helix domain-containing protein [Actinomadura madurae]MCQ0016993.1 helix-turn-helix domain-containing protein [Actinomadura madurae]